jgi:hypothetical protein
MAFCVSVSSSAMCHWCSSSAVLWMLGENRCDVQFLGAATMKPTSSHGRPCNPRMGVSTVNMSNSDVLLRFVEYTVYPYSGSCLLRPPHDRLLGAKHELPSTTAVVFLPMPSIRWIARPKFQKSSLKRQSHENVKLKRPDSGTLQSTKGFFQRIQVVDRVGLSIKWNHWQLLFWNSVYIHVIIRDFGQADGKTAQICPNSDRSSLCLFAVRVPQSILNQS